LVDRALLHTLDGDFRPARDLAERAALIGVGDPDDGEPPAEFPTELLSGFIPGGAAPGLVVAQLRGAFRHAASLVAQPQRRRHHLTHQLGLAADAMLVQQLPPLKPNLQPDRGPDKAYPTDPGWTGHPGSSPRSPSKP
jgi:hypothetical protein